MVNDGAEVRSLIGIHTGGHAKVLFYVKLHLSGMCVVGQWSEILQSGVLPTPPVSTCNRGDMREHLRRCSLWQKYHQQWWVSSIGNHIFLQG